MPITSARRAGLVAGCLLIVAVARADTPPPVHRLVLTDGSTIATFGEWARVGDRVVFSLPLGEQGGQTRMQLASVPAARVDWPATERYLDAMRADYYARTRGDEDFAAMTSAVARVLGDVAAEADPARRLALAERARQTLAAWPHEHYAYRADEVRQVLSLLDEVVSELKAQQGERSFDLSLVATALPPPAVPLLPPPTLQESIQQALAVASLADVPTERKSLLSSVAALLQAPDAGLEATWVEGTRNEVSLALARETALDRSYATLRSSALARANRAASAADVRAMEKIVREVRDENRDLTAARRQDVQALLAALDERLDAARRLRLARDQWAITSRALNGYKSAVRQPLRELGSVRPLLDDIKTLAGPDAARLPGLEERLASLGTIVRSVNAPDAAAAAHGVLVSAAQLAVNATRLRRSAVASGDLKVAWDASAAAAGALMLLDRARAELDRALRPPELR